MNKKMASQQYAANQMGGPFPKLGQKLKEVFKGKGGSKDHPGAVTMECSKDGCGTFNTGGGKSNVGRETNRQNKGGAKGLSTRSQYSKQVLKPGSRKAKRWSKSIQKVKDNKPMTREQALYESDRRKF